MAEDWEQSWAGMWPDEDMWAAENRKQEETKAQQTKIRPGIITPAHPRKLKATRLGILTAPPQGILTAAYFLPAAQIYLATHFLIYSREQGHPWL